MKKNMVGFFGAIAAAVIPVATVCGQAAATPPAVSEEAMRFSPDLAEVVKMVQAHKTEEEVLTQVKLCPRLYNLSATDAVNLDKFGVSQKVVMAMVNHDKALESQVFHPTPAPAQDSSATSRSGSGQATGQNGSNSAKSVKPVTDSSVSRPKGTPPPSTSKPKKVWTSSIIVEKAPPAAKLELVPKSPGNNHIWIRGHWAWKDGTWAWEEGYWILRPGPDIQWMDGEWSRHGKGWIWIPGHWR